MSFIRYLKYFYFISRNWNARLAAFTVYHEIKGEQKYRLDSMKINNLKHENIASVNIRHASIYQASSYYLIEKAFDYLNQENVRGAIVDFGSGKGRVMAVAAYYGFKNITGIEFSISLCHEAEKNIEKTQPFFPDTTFKIICDDVINYQIEEDKIVFFFFNPFDEVVLLQVVRKILLSLKERERKIYVLYLNPVYKEIFLSAGFEEEYYYKKMEFLELSILSWTGQDGK